MKKIIILSGGFDPVHIGHVRMFKAAKEENATVVVGVNSDLWLSRKKGQSFMPLAERIEILKGFKYIDYVHSFNDDDDTACNLIETVLKSYKNDKDIRIFFGNGGDRTSETTPEMKYCEENGVELLWEIGGEKIQSSSDLIKKSNNN